MSRVFREEISWLIKQLPAFLKFRLSAKETVAIIRLRGKLLAALGGRLYSTLCPLIGELTRIAMDI